MENSSEYYYEKLKNSISPGLVLAAMYGVLYDFQQGRSEIIMMNKLIKIFGRFTVFFSILDMVGTYPDKQENVYPLLYTICKKKFENAHSSILTQSSQPLDKYLKNIDKTLDSLSKKKVKIPSPEGLEN
jgi:hypothetical protein